MNSPGPLFELQQLLPQCILQDQLRIGWRVAAWLKTHPNPQSPPPEIAQWIQEARASIELRHWRLQRLPPIQYPPQLPITARAPEIVKAISAHQVLVIAGETGSGKTTQIPKMCLEAGFGIRAKIGCTQPRRVAAHSLSRRLAEELDMVWGREIGCKVRFSDDTSPQTYVKFMTDGMLLAEAQGDPVLSEYEVIILDEAHERSLNIDFLLGRLKQLLARRDDLKLIITSATIDTQSFSRAFDNAPIIEVSGRLYPVDVVYAPFDETSEDEGDFTYVDAAVNAVENLLIESSHGDILVFMPGERDILETRDRLQARRLGTDIEIVPLFGRLTPAEQQRIFSPTPGRKIVVATNIAESSLTVPGIRYVVDTGLARISRYNARTRTRRLPIEPIAQSSANQRKGRCGRVAEGICIRLYSEEDFNARPPYTQPEIQRANLAEVILHLKAFNLGDVESFPFINPPSPAAIQGGYQLLVELGALDDKRDLTDLGRRMARLPVDPTIGRMILQARVEGALNEVLIIAAGLSIQDPRERPIEKQEAAAAAQQRFNHPKSDFLTLLNIWNAFHDTLESMKTQNQARKFCKTHYLSYLRMREWRDIHAQLEDAVADLPPAPGAPKPNSNPDPNPGSAPRRNNNNNAISDTPNYDAIHRSILTGLWSHVALRKERNFYQLGGNRDVMLFPGSGLFEKTVEKRHRQQPTEKPAVKSTQPRWVVAAEIVETSRLFLRGAAEIDPLWIVELGSHLCKRAYLDPHWSDREGRVLSLEKVTLNGLVILERHVPHGRVNAAEATEIFIRSALMEAELARHFQRRPAVSAPRGTQPEAEDDDAIDLTLLPPLYAFLSKNRQLIEKIELWQTRLPSRVVSDLDEAVFQAYSRLIRDVSSIPELNRLLHEHHKDAAPFLQLTAADLLGSHEKAFGNNLFPDTVAVGSQAIPVSYAYAPGEDRDGVTVRLPFTLAQLINPESLDWAVPGLREPRILHLLQELPKSLRRALMPLPPKAREMALAIEPASSNYLTALSDFVRNAYGIEVPVTEWKTQLLPQHLSPRFEIIGRDQKKVAAGRDLTALRATLQNQQSANDTDAWRQAVLKWERYGIRDWNFGDLPDQITVADVAGFPLQAFPGLQLEENDVSLRLFRKPEEARDAHSRAVPRLLENALLRELGWLAKDLRGLAVCRAHYITLGPVEQLETTALENVKQHLFSPRQSWPRAAADFTKLVEDTRAVIPPLSQKMIDWISAILAARQSILMYRKPYAQMRRDLDTLITPLFLRQIPLDRLQHVPRYLKAMMIRAERAAVNPVKDQEKLRRVQPYIDTRDRLITTRKNPQKTEALRWLIEEYKVSVFAQELGTAGPVSPKAIEALIAETAG
jgi:ATP-dependent helicase HrpA